MVQNQSKDQITEGNTMGGTLVVKTKEGENMGVKDLMISCKTPCYLTLGPSKDEENILRTFNLVHSFLAVDLIP